MAIWRYQIEAHLTTTDNLSTNCNLSATDNLTTNGNLTSSDNLTMVGNLSKAWQSVNEWQSDNEWQVDNESQCANGWQSWSRTAYHSYFLLNYWRAIGNFNVLLFNAQLSLSSTTVSEVSIKMTRRKCDRSKCIWFTPILWSSLSNIHTSCSQCSWFSKRH